MKFNNEMHLPAYPLFVKDPYFSIWSMTDKLNDSNTKFWHGEEKKIFGYLYVDDKKYCFMGLSEDSKKLTQVGLEVTALRTIYHFSEEDFTFDLEFLSPLTLLDYNVLSCPVCYLCYSFKSNNKHNISVEIVVNQEICYNTCFENTIRECRANRFKLENFECVSVALERQLPMSHSNDEDAADWGSYYLAGDTCKVVKNDSIIDLYALNKHENVTKDEGFFMLGFDDIVSIFYFGEYLKGYYFAQGKTIFDALTESYSNLSLVKEKCLKEEAMVVDFASKYDEKYLFILNAAYRQAIGAHKLVKNGKGDLLFLSKESNSDGCIATVDVTYPSIPLFLLVRPELVKGMITPIFDFARFPIWDFDFAPHDVGIYPYCLGQYYAIKNNEEEQLDLMVKDWHKATLLPFYYQYPKGTPIFDFEKQMPVEESANMIIISYLYTMASKDSSIINNNFDLLSKWVNYLVKKGLRPLHQLCTDDFAGPISGNANLAIKAIEGIKCYSLICKELGMEEKSLHYSEIACAYSKEWMEIYNRGDHSILAIDLDDSFSLKYNLAIDQFLKIPLFSKEFKEAEINYYLTKMNRYGIPLDSRKAYSKTDWQLWCTTLTEDYSKRNKIIESIYLFLCETTDKVPFTDWYNTDVPTYNMFRNRTVLGGLFMPILVEKWEDLCKK